jgi:hypothetical protein
MNKLYIHIGTHKTGSTAIQHALSRSLTQLEKEGIVYIPTLPVFKQLMYSSTLDASLLESGRDQLHQRIKRFKHKESLRYVISSEALSGDPMLGYQNAHIIAKSLAEIVPDFSVSVIVYLRRQDEFIESFYTQKIHQGESLTFEEFFQTCDHAELHWDALLDSYAEQFGQDNIVAQQYHRDALPHRDSLVRGFGELIGSESLPAYTETKIANPGYSRDALETARLTNPHLGDQDRRQLRQLLQQTNTKKPFDNYSFFSFSERMAFLSEFEQSNTRVARAYLKHDSQALFPPPTEPSDVPIYGGLTIESMALVFAKVLAAKQAEGSRILRPVVRFEKFMIRHLSRFPRLWKWIKSVEKKLR